MSTPDIAESERPARVGRPPTIDRDLIAQAASEIGLANLTMQAVAERLGVSVASLYYHVRDRSELTRLAAEHATAKVGKPVEHGQHWSVWLAEWAEYSRHAFAADPEALQQFVAGTLGAEQILSNLDVIIGHLVDQGFGADEAMDAYSLVSSCAIGAAITELRARNSLAKLEVPSPPLEGHPNLMRLRPDYSTPSFADQIDAVLLGIAVKRGEELDPLPRSGGRRR